VLSRISSSQWKSVKPAVLIGLALALLQIGFGVASYYQSKNILWESKYQTAENLTQGLVVAIADQIVLKDYASVESRIMQTMSNAEVASVLLTDTSGKVITYLKRSAGNAPKLMFEPTWLQTPTGTSYSIQSRDDAFITTWGRVNLGLDLGWVRLQTFNELDTDSLGSLRQNTLLLSALSVLSGVLILGVFLWRAYFTVVKREHMFEVKLNEATKRLVQSEKLASLGELAAGVAHEINNPVGYVSSNLTTLQKYLSIYEKILDAQSQTETTNEIQALKQKLNYAFIREDLQSLMNETQEGVSRVKTIIQDLKDYARTNAAAQYVEADIHVGLKSTLNIAKAQLKDRADVNMALGKLPLIDCAPSQIDQVFLNLIVNAAQAMPEGKRGLIQIRTNCHDKTISIEIEDNGPGIEPAVLEKIFDPFFTTKDPGTGTGLGLSVSQNIIQQHGGTIQVKSQVGLGTTFKITLPIKQPPAKGIGNANA
jgi:signal transduction histidine kinase